MWYEALEEMFERQQLNYLDPLRDSVVEEVESVSEAEN
jgi:hypothetical protein